MDREKISLMKRHLSKHRHWIVGGVAVFLLLYYAGGSAVEWLLPRLVNYADIKKTVEKAVSNDIFVTPGVHFDIKTLDIQPTLTQGIRVVFSQSALYTNIRRKTVRTDRINAYIRYWPLITQGRQEISKLQFYNLRAFVKDASFLFKLKPINPAQKKNVVLKNTTIEFFNYRIVVDRYIDGMHRFLLAGDYLRFGHLFSPDKLTSKGNANIWFIRTPFIPAHHGVLTYDPLAHLKLTLDMSQIDLAKKHVSPDSLHTLHVDVDDLNLNNLAILLSHHHLPVAGHGLLDHLMLVFDQRRTLFTGEPGYNFAFNVDNSRNIALVANNYRFNLLPGHLKIQSRLARHQQFQNTMIALDSQPLHFKVTGDMTAPKPFPVVDLLKPATLLNSKLNLHVKTGDIPVGILRFLPRNTPTGDLMQDAGGFIALDSNIKGYPGNPILSGAIGLRDVSVAIASPKNSSPAKDSTHLPSPPADQTGLTDFNGTILLQGQDVAFDHLKGRLFGSPLEINGDYSLKKTSLFSGKREGYLHGTLRANDLRLAAALETLRQFSRQFHLMKGLGGDIFDGYDVRGLATVHVGVDGPVTHPNLFGGVVFKNVEAAYQGAPLLRNLNAVLKFQKQLIAISQLTAQVPESPVQVRGLIQLDNRLANLRVTAHDLDTGQLKNDVSKLIAVFHAPADTVAMLNQYQVQGPVDMDINLKGPLAKPDYMGRLAFNNVSVQDVKRQITVSKLNGNVEAGLAEIKINRLQGQLGSTPFLAEGSLGKAFKRNQPPDYKIGLTSQNMDLAQLHKEVLSKIPEFQPEVRQYKDLSGLADIRLTFHTPSQGAPTPFFGMISLRNFGIDPLIVSRHIRIPQTRATFTPDGRLYVDNTQIQIGRQHQYILHVQNGPVARAASSGKKNEAAGWNYNLNVTSDPIPMQSLENERHYLLKNFHQSLPQFTHLSGSALLQAHLEPARQNALLSFNNATFGTTDMIAPIRHIRGDLLISNPIAITSQNLRFHYQQNRYRANLDIHAASPSSSIESPSLLALQGRVAVDVYSPLAAQPPAPKQVEKAIPIHLPGHKKAYVINPMHPIRTAKTVGTTVGTVVTHVIPEAGLHPIQSAKTVLKALPEVGRHPLHTAESVVSVLLPEKRKTGENAPPPIASGAAVPLAGKEEKPVGVVSAVSSTGEMPVGMLATAPETPKRHSATPVHVGTITSMFDLNHETLHLHALTLNLVGGGTLTINGNIQHVFTEPSYALNLLTDNPVNLERLGYSIKALQGSSGTIWTNMAIQGGSSSNPSLQGELRLNQIHIPAYDVQTITGTADFQDKVGHFNVQSFQIPGVDVALTGDIQNASVLPLKIANLQIKGKEFVVESFQSFVNDTLSKRLQKEVIEPNIGKIKTNFNVPFEIHDGHIAMDEVVFNNILMSNGTCRLEVLPSGYFELNDMKVSAAGGSATGRITVDPTRNNFSTVQLQADNVKANALAVALLHAPNQVFGRLDAKIQYTTQGQTNDETMNNTNGVASFHIKNGRLPNIAKIETLLTAANIFRGGLVGLNLNNILRSLDAFDTNYFADLSGDFRMQKGIAYTNNLTSKGKNLSLLIKGSSRLVDGNADMMVYGKMSQDVSGILGPIGKLSLEQIVRYIPGVGYVPGVPNSRGIITMIPGVGFVPGFGGPAKDINRFKVQIKGPLAEQSSIHNFEWVR